MALSYRCLEKLNHENEGGEWMQLNYSKLRGKIKEIFGTQEAFAEALGIGRVSLSQRLNNLLEFTQDEMFKACELLKISACDIPDYFFCPLSLENLNGRRGEEK